MKRQMLCVWYWPLGRHNDLDRWSDATEDGSFFLSMPNIHTHTHTSGMHVILSEWKVTCFYIYLLSLSLTVFFFIFFLFFLRSSLSPSSSICLSGQRRTVLYGERLIFPPFPSLAGILTESWLYGNKENCSLTTEGEGEQNLSYMLWQTLVEKLQ